MKYNEGWTLLKRGKNGDTEVYPVLLNEGVMEMRTDKDEMWNYILKKQPQFQNDILRLKNSVQHSNYQLVRVKCHLDKKVAKMEVLEVARTI